MHQTQVRDGQRVETGNLIRNRLALFYLVAYLLFAAPALRLVNDFYDTPYRGYILGLLVAYFILLSTERPLSTRFPRYQYVYFAIQILLVLAITRAVPTVDYYPTLCIGLCIQAIWFAPQNAGIFWIGLMLVCTTVSEIYLYGLLEGLGYVLVYISAGFFISIFGITTLRAERAQAKSQALLVELQSANYKLKEYADQVEALVKVQERNRLARELHDSVTQTIFSITLTAQSALILMERDPARVKEQLQQLQSLSKNALAEMRALIQQLHPHTPAEEGLLAALQQHKLERKEKDGLAVEIKVLCEDEPPGRLPVEVEQELFRVIQEALNNVVKHAQTDRASVALDFRSNPVRIIIADQGVGFDPKKLSGAPGHLGLTSMQERVRAMGGRLTIDTKPGAGTRIQIDNLRLEEREDA
jgi:signal transduction histidine kinase